MFLKKYKNQLFNHLKNHLLISLDDFEMEINGRLLALKHKSSQFRFVVRVTESDMHSFDYRYTRFALGFPSSDFLPIDHFLSFDEVCKEFDLWVREELYEYLSEQDEIDLWEQYKKGESLLDIAKIDFGDKTNFGQDERQQIKLAINDLKLLIHKQFETSVEEQKLVNERLDYLIESCERLNRFDWKSLAINTIISISITLSLDTEKGHALFNLFKQVFRIMPLLFGGDAHH